MRRLLVTTYNGTTEYFDAEGVREGDDGTLSVLGAEEAVIAQFRPSAWTYWRLLPE